MAKRVGYTSDVEVAQWEVGQKFRNARNWKSTEPFLTKDEAVVWVSKAKEKYSCKDVVLQNQKKSRRPRWYGFLFEHDGPKN